MRRLESVLNRRAKDQDDECQSFLKQKRVAPGQLRLNLGYGTRDLHWHDE